MWNGGRIADWTRRMWCDRHNILLPPLHIRYLHQSSVKIKLAMGRPDFDATVLKIRDLDSQ
jgi:hypothetical protein